MIERTPEDYSFDLSGFASAVKFHKDVFDFFFFFFLQRDM